MVVRPHLRFAEKEDSAAIIDIMHRTGIGEQHIYDGNIDDFLEELVIVAEHKDTKEVLAYGMFIVGRRNAYISDLAVLPEYQNHGIGYAVYLEIMAFLYAKGVSHTFAVTHPDEGKGVRKMLHHLGYHEIGSMIGLQKDLN